MDVLMIVGTFVFFAVGWAYVVACDHI